MILNRSSVLSAAIILGAFSLSACNLEDAATTVVTAVVAATAATPEEAVVVPTEPVTSLESIVGVYLITEDYGTDGIDEGYMVIDDAGNVTWYDDQSDTFDKGGNCYVVDDDYYNFVFLSENRFDTDLGTATITDNAGAGLIIEFDDSMESDITLGNRSNLLESYFNTLVCPAASENPSASDDGEKTPKQQEKEDKKDSQKEKKDSHENANDSDFQDKKESAKDKGGK
ncbi:hypothetical protein [Reinekea forsetii]|uniref:Lipoprotein n=1 Tax=Reinekea forsetii TaxID=1336806 RepID=A0A2K8KTK8_9GAMM|nr:hypothetical protein [Reinekea forsetii]ATX78075.1 hypothetical protein REIFOR_02954 [Reinekea forsetii]